MDVQCLLTAFSETTSRCTIALLDRPRDLNRGSCEEDPEEQTAQPGDITQATGPKPMPS